MDGGYAASASTSPASSPGLAAKTSFYGLYLYNEGQVRLWPYRAPMAGTTADVLRRLRAGDGRIVEVKAVNEVLAARPGEDDMTLAAYA